MSNIKDTDTYLVSREGTEFKVKSEDTSNLRDTDLFWVQREGVNYSVTADQVNAGGQIQEPELSLVTLSKTTTGDRYTDQQFLTAPSFTTPGNPAPTVGLKAEVTGALSIVGATDEIVGISAGTNYTDTSTFTDVGIETLTLASDANLETFKAGDAVKQNNSPVTPVSSTITNVGVVQLANKSAIWSSNCTQDPNWGFNANFRGMFNGDNTISGDWRGNTYFTISPGIQVNSSLELRMSAEGPDLTTQLKLNGQHLNPPITLGSVVRSFTFDIDAPINITRVELDPPLNSASGGYRCKVWEWIVDGLVLIDSDSPVELDQTSLTLTDTTDLDLFEVGDVVQGPFWNQSEVWSNNLSGSFSSSGNYNADKAFDGNPATGALTSDVGTDMTYTGTLTGVNTLRIQIRPVGMGSPNAVFQVSGTGIETTQITGETISESLVNIPLTSTTVSDILISNPSGGPESQGISQMEVNGSLLVDTGVSGNLSVSITAISESTPSITTDGGSWKGTDGTGENWNQTKVWSDVCTFTAGGASSSLPLTNAFTNRNPLVNTEGDTTNALCVIPIDATVAVGGVEVYFYAIDGEVKLFYQGTRVEIVRGGNGWLSNATYSGPIDEIQIGRTDRAFEFAGVKINGELLVNAGIPLDTFVTGPTKTITATYVSSDPSVPSMTVSDAVGPWSANTGNYVENTVVNPIMIKPETSAIVATTNPQRVSDSIDMEKMAGSNPFVQGPAYVFDNNTTTAAVTDGITINEGDTVKVYLNTESGTDNFTFTTTGGSTNFQITSGGGAWNGTPVAAEWVSTYTGVWTSVSRTSGTRNCGFFSCYINGVRVLQGDTLVDTVLTLTDDTDLNQFATGDNVYAGGVAPGGFAPVLYTGNLATQSITGVGFAPDLVWIKSRANNTSHGLFDTVRGAGKGLYSDATNAEYDLTTTLSSFDPDGFTLGNNDTYNNTGNYVAWCWSAGGTTVTNNEGDIESQVRSNGSFSVVSYTGNLTGDGSVTVGHGLELAPALIITKRTDGESRWAVQHKDLADNHLLSLDTANPSDLFDYGDLTNRTSSIFSTNYTSGMNTATDDFIGYCWCESPTQSFGKYTGTGETNAIDCGFEPTFVMIKCSTLTDTWWTIFDTVRDPANPNNVQLYPNEANEETVYGPRQIDITSTGFTIKGPDSFVNSSGETYIYAAFAEVGGGPSGVVGDITGLRMTLSESTGNWEVGQTVTKDEGPALATTASLVFDANGQVSDVVSNADFVNMNSNTPIITLPSTFGDGSTPDETLPDGTSIKTTVRAWNELGESIKSSNSVTPTTTTKLAMGESRLIDGYTPVVTAHARAVITEAEEIKDDIERATDNLNIAIANYEEQGKRRSV